MGLLDATTRVSNESLIHCLTDTDAGIRKEAADAVQDYLRMGNPEDGFSDQILPHTPITAANLDRQSDTPDPVVIIDIEPESAGAYTVPFGTGPQTRTIEAGRFPVFIRRIETDRYQSDRNRLLTWNMDIKQILKDHLMKDLHRVQDTMLMATSESILTQVPVNTVNPLVGACQWTTQGPLSRASLAYARKGLPSTNRHLNATVGLINNLTVWDIPTLTRDEVGGNLAEDMFINGATMKKVQGLNLIVTNKTDLVKTNDLYQFADPEHTGVFLVLDETILSTEVIHFMIEFWAYKSVGMAIRNIAALCKTSFTDYAVDWETGDAAGSSSNIPESGSSL